MKKIKCFAKRANSAIQKLILVEGCRTVQELETLAFVFQFSNDNSKMSNNLSVSACVFVRKNVKKSF